MYKLELRPVLHVYAVYSYHTMESLQEKKCILFYARRFYGNVLLSFYRIFFSISFSSKCKISLLVLRREPVLIHIDLWYQLTHYVNFKKTWKKVPTFYRKLLFYFYCYRLVKRKESEFFPSLIPFLGEMEIFFILCLRNIIYFLVNFLKTFRIFNNIFN